jgi:chemotaxis signal transduction protein
MRPLPIDEYAQAPPFVLGTAVIRGAPVAVVDAEWLLTGKRGVPRRFVTLAVGSDAVALGVPEVLGTSQLSPGEMSPLPSLLAEAADVVRALRVLDGGLLEILSSARIVERTSLFNARGAVD